MSKQLCAMIVLVSFLPVMRAPMIYCRGSLPALVGNNRVYREWGVLVSYYLPGNSLAPPPSHRASGATAQVVVEHAILGSVIFHPTWAVAEWWSTLILPVCDPPQPVCGHYNDAPSYFHCLAMKSAHWSQYCKHHCSCTYIVIGECCPMDL